MINCAAQCVRCEDVLLLCALDVLSV
ncbi:Protein of unknown function [Pyronema omphalodes CBS 100304]|uniref:Uncharacterized protein n=1 Tax=Pyronema omphalodes (strain CBS 100304) TaxID=1076935 RepID=U4L2Q3_PYROM|nr:Protein of unknown function [Pyronema omphalodes CBS 100304]